MTTSLPFESLILWFPFVDPITMVLPDPDRPFSLLRSISSFRVFLELTSYSTFTPTLLEAIFSSPFPTQSAYSLGHFSQPQLSKQLGPIPFRSEEHTSELQ